MLDAPVQRVEAFGYSGRDDDGDDKDGEDLAEGRRRGGWGGGELWVTARR